MPLYAGEDFDSSILPGNMKKDTREIIEMAALVGWSVHVTSNKSVTIKSPVREDKSHHFGVTGRGTKNRNTIKKDIFKYGDPQKVMIAAESMHLSDPGILTAIAGVLDATAEAVHDDRPKPEDRKPRREPEVDTVKSEPEETPAPERHIVDQRPMLASSGHYRRGKEARAYESETTLERRWSDGKVDYACRYPDCTYSSETRIAPSRHYGATHTVGQGTQKRPTTFKGEVPDKTQYTYQPRLTRVEALAEVIRQMIEEGITEPEKIAEAALKWVHEQTDQNTDLSGLHEPMTAEQKLARIAVILDDGTRFALEKEARERADEVAALTARAEAAEHRLEVTSSNLQALRELFDGLDVEAS